MDERDAEALIQEWRDKFTTRRTVPHKMLREAEVLVRDAIARGRTENDWKQKLELADHARKAERLQAQLSKVTTERDDLLAHRKGLTEARETLDGAVKVRIAAPREPSYSNDDRARNWQVGELEEVVMRLRIAGATDTTSVNVPFPEYALTPAPTPMPESAPTQTRAAILAALVVALITIFLMGLAHL